MFRSSKLVLKSTFEKEKKANICDILCFSRNVAGGMRWQNQVRQPGSPFALWVDTVNESLFSTRTTYCVPAQPHVNIHISQRLIHLQQLVLL